MFKGKFYSESELTLKVTIDRKNSEVSRVPIKGGSHCIPSAFNINQALKLGRSQTCHISELSVSKRTWIYAREKKDTTKYDDAIESC